MKKMILWSNSVLAALVLVVANFASGMASCFGWHQPKVPERFNEK